MISLIYMFSANKLFIAIEMKVNFTLNFPVLNNALKSFSYTNITVIKN